MKVNAIFLKSKNKNEKHLAHKLNTPLVISCITIILGMTMGTAVYLLNESFISQNVVNQFAAFFTDFSGKSFFEILCGNLSTYAIYYCAIIILGTCAFGCIPVLAVTFFNCFGIGVLTAFIFSSYKLSGLEYFLLNLFPGKSIFMLAMVMLCHICTSSSLNIKKALSNDRGEPFKTKLYFTKCLIALVFIVAASLIDAIMIRSFSSLFSF